MTEHCTPQVAPGLAQAGTSLPDAVSGMRYDTANQAQRIVICYTPSAVVLNVEAAKPILDAMMQRVIDRMCDG